MHTIVVMFEKEIVNALRKNVKGDISLAVPPDPAMGDFSFPCFVLAKELKKSPVQVAQELAKTIPMPDFVSKIAAVGPYVNFFLDPAKVAVALFSEILLRKDRFGSSDL